MTPVGPPNEWLAGLVLCLPEIKMEAPRFDLAQCRNPAEREFINALHARAEAGGWFADSWPVPGKIIVSVDIVDAAANCVLRMLRVDFDGSSLIYGRDETFQLVTDLDPASLDVVVVADKPPADLANIAADWLEREMRRPVVCHEWHRPEFSHKEWLFADTGEQLVWSDSANAKRGELGRPDKITPVDGA